jgi:diacylglycerol kinase (ATP)
VRTLFIVNPTSGRDRSAPLRRKLLDYVAGQSESDAVVLTGPGEAACVAGEAAGRGYKCIVVAGGDGTVNEVINGIGDDDLCLGIVPLGTGNVLASELGLDCDSLDDSLGAIAAGRIRQFDLGLAGDRRFLLMAGFGFDAEVVRDVASRAKGIFGRMAYAPTLVRESVCYRPSEFRLTLDDTCLSTTAYNVIVCNCATYAPNFQIAPDARPDDGVLDLLIFEHRPAMKLRFLGWLWASLFTQWAADSTAVHYRAKRLRIESTPTVKMQLDGDVRGESGVDIKVLPKALRLIVP